MTEELSYVTACETCKHREKHMSDSPCDTCKWANSSNNWEPIEGTESEGDKDK